MARLPACCQANGGAPGVDGQTFADIETYGVEKWLDELAEELRDEDVSSASRAAGVHSQAGRQATDRWAFRRSKIAWCRWRRCWSWSRSSRPTCSRSNTPTDPDRSALDAVRNTSTALLNTGHTEVVDADLSGYFDSIPHAELMKSVARRVSDRHMLHLIKMWLEAPVEEIDERGRKHRTTRNKDEGRGTPQGAPISPLLSNLYMRRFMLGWKMLGHETASAGPHRQLRGRLRDLLSRHGRPGHDRDAEHDAKAEADGERDQDACLSAAGRIVRLPGVHHSAAVTRRRTGRAYLGDTPVAEEGSGGLPRDQRADEPTMVLVETWRIKWRRLNRMLVGWANYFCLGPVSKAYRAVDRHTGRRLRQWLCRKHKVQGRGSSRYPDEYLYQELGLVRLRLRDAQLSVGERMSPCPRAGCGKSARPVR